jgi:hypothetical protein
MMGLLALPSGSSSMHHLKWVALVGLAVWGGGCGSGGENVSPPSAAEASQTQPIEETPKSSTATSTSDALQVN